MGVVVRIGRLQTPGGWPSGNRASPKFGLHEQVINHLNWAVPRLARDATRWRSSGRVAVYGAGLAGCWTRLTRRAQRPPERHGGFRPHCGNSAVPEARAGIQTLRQIGKILPHSLGSFSNGWIGTVFRIERLPALGTSMRCRLQLRENLPQVARISEQIMQPRQPRRNRAEVLPKPFEHVLSGRTGCHSGFVGFVGSTLAFAARNAGRRPSTVGARASSAGSARHESWETQRKWHLQNLQNRVLMVL